MVAYVHDQSDWSDGAMRHKVPLPPLRCSNTEGFCPDSTRSVSLIDSAVIAQALARGVADTAVLCYKGHARSRSVREATKAHSGSFATAATVIQMPWLPAAHSTVGLVPAGILRTAKNVCTSV
jgi:hypothetical protein